MMDNSLTTFTNKRLDLLTEIEQTPEEYIPELLQLVRFFRQSIVMKEASSNSWNDAINQIDNSNITTVKDKQTRIQQLLESWSQMDDQEEQKETLVSNSTPGLNYNNDSNEL